MRKINPVHMLLTLMAILLIFAQPSTAMAEETSDYDIIIEDNADLLTDEEEADLLEVMKPISTHGHVAFISIETNPDNDAEEYARGVYQAYFGDDSGTLFLIDMDTRYIWIHSDGMIYRTITTAYANTITDNVYDYASDEDYYLCASKAFSQINTLLEGRHIAQPMKYISNALLAMLIALLVNYFLAMALSRSKKPSTSQLLSGVFTKTEIHNARTNFVHQTKRYSPQSSSSSSGSSRSGGGGSSGGGGGHRF